MIWKILIIFSIVVAILLYLVILGANMSKTIEEQEEEDYWQMFAIKEMEEKKER